MPAAQTTIATQDAATYLARLAGHTGKMAAATGRLRHGPRAHADGTPPRIKDVQRDDDETTVILDRGQWTMRADADRLDILVQASDEADLRSIQDLLTTRVRKLAHRERLTINWRAASGLPVLATDTVSAAFIGTRVGSVHE